MAEFKKQWILSKIMEFAQLLVKNYQSETELKKVFC